MSNRSIRRFLLAVSAALAILKTTIGVHAQDNSQEPRERDASQGAQHEEVGQDIQPFPGALSTWNRFQSIGDAPSPKANAGGNDKPDTRPEQKTWYDRYILDRITDWLLVLFNGLLVAFTYRLHRSTAGLWEAARVQADDMKKAVLASERSATAAERSIETANLASQMQLRAYVGINEAGIRLEEVTKTEAFGKIRIKLLNTGSTPAFRIKCYIGIQYGECFDATIDAERVVGSTYIFPGESQSIISKIYPIEIPSNNCESFIFGRFEYIDAFNKNRTTNFRMIIAQFSIEKRSATLGACAEGNEAD